MKRIILFAILCLFSISISAQDNLFQKAKDAFDTKNYELSIKYLNELISKPYEKNDEYTECELNVYLALANKLNGNEKAFSDILTKTIDKYPDNEYAYSTYVAIRLDEGNFDDIMAFIDKLSAKHPQYKAKYLFMKARVVMKKDDNFKTAEPIYEQVLQLDPNNNLAITDVGVFSMLYADKLKEEEVATSDPSKKDQLRKEMIHYYKKAADQLINAYRKSDNDTDRGEILQFLGETAQRLDELNVDTSKYKL